MFSKCFPDLGILVKNSSFRVFVPSPIIITDAFMREILQPKTLMMEATETCYLSLLSWRITNILLKDMFKIEDIVETQTVFTVILASIANKRIQTFDPNFVSNVILENPKENPEANIYTTTLCDYISEDFVSFFKWYISLSPEETKGFVNDIFDKYQDIIQNCVSKIQGVTYILDV